MNLLHWILFCKTHEWREKRWRPSYIFFCGYVRCFIPLNRCFPELTSMSYRSVIIATSRCSHHYRCMYVFCAWNHYRYNLWSRWSVNCPFQLHKLFMGIRTFRRDVWCYRFTLFHARLHGDITLSVWHCLSSREDTSFHVVFQLKRPQQKLRWRQNKRRRPVSECLQSDTLLYSSHRLLCSLHVNLADAG